MFFNSFVVHFGDRLPLPSAIMHTIFRLKDRRLKNSAKNRDDLSIFMLWFDDDRLRIGEEKKQNKTGNTKRSRVELHRRWTTHIRRINERSQRLITNCIKNADWAVLLFIYFKSFSCWCLLDSILYVYCVWSSICFAVELTSHIIYESSSESIRADAAAAGLRALLPSRWMRWLHASAASQTFLLHHQQAFCSARFCAIRPVVSLRILYAVNNTYNNWQVDTTTDFSSIKLV